MSKEIERKYLIDEHLFKEWLNPINLLSTEYMSQSYFMNISGHTLRLRMSNLGDVITYKGPTRGITRTEIEFTPYKWVTRTLMHICPTWLRKIRQKVLYESQVFEVDTFTNLDRPLVIAELELYSEDTTITLPPWITEEVSDDASYYNSNLIKRVLK